MRRSFTFNGLDGFGLLETRLSLSTVAPRSIDLPPPDPEPDPGPFPGDDTPIEHPPIPPSR